MKKLARFPLIGLVTVVIAACGSAATPGPTSSGAVPTTVNVAQETPRPTQEKSRISIQFACIFRPSRVCQHIETVFAPMVAERTGGRAEIRVTSLAELGVPGVQAFESVKRGQLEIANLYSGWAGVDWPLLDVGNLVGTVRDKSALEAAMTEADADLLNEVSEATGGGVVLFKNTDSTDTFLWSRHALLSPNDFRGKNFYRISLATDHIVTSFGGRPLTMSFADAYAGFESGTLDAGFSCGTCGVTFQWHKVAGYMIGPFVTNIYTWAVMNREVWNRVPEELQRTLKEVGREYELLLDAQAKEAEAGVISAAEAQGMEHIPLTPELADAVFRVGKNTVLPDWVERTGGPNGKGARMWNEHFAPRLGLRIEPDGSVVEVPVVAQ